MISNVIDQVVHLLVESGAEKDHPAMEGVTPLFAAAFSGRFEVARFLVQAPPVQLCGVALSRS